MDNLEFTIESYLDKLVKKELAKIPVEKVCVNCKQTFKTNKKDKVYCTKACRDSKWRAVYSANYERAFLKPE